MPQRTSNDLLSYWNDFFKKILPDLSYQAKMFYMRYNDVNDHVRIRVNCDSIENNFSLYLATVEDLFPKLIESGIVSEIEVSSYKPEVNRYGGPNLIGYAEKIFCKESLLFMDKTIKLSDSDRVICATYLVLYYLNYFFKDETYVFLSY